MSKPVVVMNPRQHARECVFIAAEWEDELIQSPEGGGKTLHGPAARAYEFMQWLQEVGGWPECAPDKCEWFTDTDD